MTHSKSDRDRCSELRKQAEATLKANGDVNEVLSMDAARLVQELRTHHIELELQNEELRIAQEDLIESRDKYAHLYDYAPVGYITVIPAGLIESANLTLAGMFNVNRSSLVNRKITSLILPDDQDIFYRARRELAVQKKKASCELRLLRTDSEPFWAKLDLALTDPDLGSDSPLRIVISDISAKKEAEQSEQAMQEKLVDAERMASLSVLAAGVAHDINNMLGPVLALPDIVKEDLIEIPDTFKQVKESISECMDQIRVAAQVSSNVVRDLTLLSTQGRCELAPVDLNSLDCLSENSHIQDTVLHNREGIVVKSDISPEPLIVSGNKSHLHRALLNLIHNAADAIEAEGEISVSTRKIKLDAPLKGSNPVPAGTYAVVTVADTGRGIGAVDLRHIFEPFFTKKKYSSRSGSGLGLSVVAGIVNTHNGFIDVQSAADKGTTFTVYLPLIDKDLPTPQPAAQPASPGSETVLIVDDEPGQRFLCNIALKRLGYQTVAVASGREAVAKFREAKEADAPSPFALVLLDMIMETDFDGLQTCDAIQKLYPGQKTIIVSGYSPETRAATAKRMGADWLAKPYTIPELASAIRKQLDREE